MWSYRVQVWLAVLLCLTAAMPMARASPCFEQHEGPLTASCLGHIGAIDADTQALRSLGRRLEIEGRYKHAAEFYRYSLSVHRSDKALQRGLIRVRNEIRGRAILAGFDRETNEVLATPCWTRRWEAAVAACGQELVTNAEDWALHERYGDALRSVGRPAAALAAYRMSLSINSTNPSLRRKHNILLELVDLEQAELTIEELPQLASTYPQAAAAPEIEATIAGQIHGGRYRAVVFGNQNYENFEDLDSPIADARAISGLLRESYGFEVDTVTDATRYQIFNVLADLRRNSADYDNVLIYYAGHGYLDVVTKRGYWLPVDAERDNAANWVSTSDITNLVAGLQSTHALVVADSCFSGTLTRSAAIDTFESRQALLDRLSSRRSRMILTSGGLEPVLDGGNPFSSHSVFADALIDALLANDSIVEAGRLFVEIRDSVSRVSDQTPQYAPMRSAGHDGGDFIFIRRIDAVRTAK